MTISLARVAALLYLLALAFPAFAQAPAASPSARVVLADAAMSDGSLVNGLSAPGTFVHQGTMSSSQA